MSASPDSGGPHGHEHGEAAPAARSGRHLVPAMIGLYVVALASAWCVARWAEGGDQPQAPPVARPAHKETALGPASVPVPVPPRVPMIERRSVDLAPPRPDEIRAPWLAGRTDTDSAVR